MRFEAFVAARYLRSKRRNRFVSLITIISVAGVGVGVMALIVVLSVMTGFDIALRDAIIGNRAHLTIVPEFGGRIHAYDAVIEQLMRAAPGIEAAAPIVQIEALLSYGGNATGGYILGVEPALEEQVTMISENLTRAGGRTFSAGELPREKEIILGFRLAQRLFGPMEPERMIGRHIAVVTARQTLTPLGPRRGTQIFLTVSGISQAKMSEFDMVYAWVDLATARMLTGVDGVDGVHAKVGDPFLAARTKEAIANSSLPYAASTWYDNQREFFDALQQEKLAMFIILGFIVLVAAFNITSTLIMLVMEKRRDIGILRTLGASNTSIFNLFLVEGLMIGLSGTIAGVVFGILFALNLNPILHFIAWCVGWDIFSSVIYYFDGIPVAVVWTDVVWISLSAVILTVLSTLYPAWSAMRVDPVDALRNE